MDDFNIVAAIDFGTALSGCAYSTRKDFKDDKLLINCQQCWNQYDSMNQNMVKTATCILLHNKKGFEAFGFDAQSRYTHLDIKEKDEYLYFSYFKMSLYNSTVPLHKLQIKDVRRKDSKPAEELVSLSIKALKDSLINEIKETGKYPETDLKIRWVLTVPAIWDDEAKLFMRECARKADIPNNRLFLALEPEAASVYCNILKTERPEQISEGFKVAEPGTQFVVLDIGGGTTDITVLQKLENGTLRQLTSASGEDVGGMSVNTAILNLISILYNIDIVSVLQVENPSIFLDLYNDLEETKKQIQMNSKDPVIFRINQKVFDKLLVDKGAIANDSISFKVAHDELEIDYMLVHGRFNEVVRSIVSALKGELEKKEAKQVTTILLVGGFGKCELIHDAMKANFPNHRLIIPDEAGTAVLQGAVIYGHDPSVISSRVTRFTYGVSGIVPFANGKHNENKRVVRDGKQYCKEIFSPIQAKNKIVHRGTSVQKRFPINKSNVLKTSIYASTEEYPMYVDDSSCKKVATIEMALHSTSQFIDIEFYFGDTEIIVKATEEGNKCTVETHLTFE